MTCRFCGKEDGRVLTMPIGGFCQCMQRKGGAPMNLTEEQRKMLTKKLLEECWHDIQPRPCGVFLCLKCGYTPDKIMDEHNRTFLTWQDLGDCKEALEKEGLWVDFITEMIDLWERRNNYVDLKIPEFSYWLFRPTDEKGETHFCRLVAEFMEAEK